MSSFIVMQGETYHHEKKWGIIWSPLTDKSGMVPHSYKRMQEVKKGDHIFHYVKGAIVAISSVTEDCKEASRTSAKAGPSDGVGYLVATEYRELETPLPINEYIQVITPFLPKKYSAFQEDGSGNPGYLYPCNEELTLKLLECISSLNIYVPSEEQLELAIEVVRRTEHHPLVTLIAEMALEAKTKIERGELQFRKRLLPIWNSECPICGIKMDALLKASYAIPWKDSTDQERVNPYNGMVLCSNHDAMYLSGLITVSASGKLQVSKKISEEEYPLYGLAKGLKISVYPENEFFLKWHKKNVFLDKRKRILTRPPVQ